MKIALIGYGKMGKIIDQIAQKRGHDIVARIDIHNQQELSDLQADVAIEFSHPEAAFNNIKICLERGIPVISGTTGWLSKKDKIEKICSDHDGTFFYASNFSLGVNLFFKVNEYLAKMMNAFDEYDVSMDEIHHAEKKDAPSGTAISLAEGIIKNLNRKERWSGEDHERSEELVIKSFRIDQVPGTHVVKYGSAVDDIEIKHTAHSREGFAKGAVRVAEWLPGKRGVLNMDDFLKFQATPND